MITEDGNVSKHGWIMSQCAKVVRPGYVRIGLTQNPYPDVHVTAYEGGAGKVVVVAVNDGTAQRRVDLAFGNGAPRTLKRCVTSAATNESHAGDYPVIAGGASADLEPSSASTFVSRPPTADLTGSSCRAAWRPTASRAPSAAARVRPSSSATARRSTNCCKAVTLGGLLGFDAAFDIAPGGTIGTGFGIALVNAALDNYVPGTTGNVAAIGLLPGAPATVRADAAFATVTPVPEPAGLPVFATGCTLAALALRRRARS